MKCKCIWISLSSSELVPFTYCINGSPVDSVPHYRDLGVHFSNDLSWTYHHSTIISKAYNTLHFLRRTMSPRHSSATRPRHSSLVWSNLAYSSQVWRLHLLKDIRSIEKGSTLIYQIYSEWLCFWLQIWTNLLPLSLWFELMDTMFPINCFKYPEEHFKIFLL